MAVQVSPYYRDKGDRVSFSTFDPDGKEHVYTNRICYGEQGYNGAVWSPDVEIVCRPAGGRNSAPPLVFQRYFRLLTKHGIVPKVCRAKTRDGLNTLFIPRQDWGYHPLFITLSMYRHADQHGKSILGRTMKLYRDLKPEGTHFLQCLHWAFANTGYGTWHSCINLTSCRSVYDGGGDPDRLLDLRWGLALALYGQLSPEDKKTLPQRLSTDMFDELALDLRSFPIEHLDHILDPQYALYYADPKKALKG
jgi:hypothetical protein